MRPSVIHRGARWAAGLAVLLAACSSAPAPAGRELDVTIKDFKVLPSVRTTEEGAVTFEISNDGRTTHEFVVAELDDSAVATSGRSNAYAGSGDGSSASSRGYGHDSDADDRSADTTEGTLLPVGADGLSVDEDAIHVVDELEEIEDGTVGSLTVSLEPGRYVLFCNLEGHYLSGMYATIEVA